jgi:hypothetical protein
MASNFPNAPFPDQIFVDPISDITYLWNGSAWTGTSPGGILYQGTQIWDYDLTGINTTSKVGINKVNPFYELDVVGTTRVSGLITATSLHINNNASITGITTVNGFLNTSELRVKSTAEKLTRGIGNLVRINYRQGDGNVGFCSNPTGDIVLEVVGIPTDASFDNNILTFSVIVQQTGIARTCNRVKLNGVISSIKWPEGIVGLGNTNCIDIFNFTAFNTVGSASSTANYTVLGLVNGDYR